MRRFSFGGLVVLVALLGLVLPAQAGKKKKKKKDTEPPTTEAAAPAEAEPAVAERTGLVRRGERRLTLVGPGLEVGKEAPAGVLRGAGLAEVPVDFKDGVVRVVLIVPSLDTPTCSMQTRTFNSRASELGEGVEILVISRDLPPAQERFCAAHGIDRVRTLSDYVDGSFGRSWGLYVKETALLARAVVIIDGAGLVQYEQIVEDLPDEPDYDTALAAVTRLVPPDDDPPTEEPAKDEPAKK